MQDGCMFELNQGRDRRYMAAELSKCDFRNDRSVSLDVIQLNQENKNTSSEGLAQRGVLMMEIRTDVAGCAQVVAQQQGQNPERQL